MKNSKPLHFTGAAVTAADAEDVYNNLTNDGRGGLTKFTVDNADSWCESNEGTVFRDSDGKLASTCFFKHQELPLRSGSRPDYGTVPVHYFHHNWAASRYGGLELGRRAGESCLGLAYTATEDAFPSCVACTFIDNPEQTQSHRRAGMFIIPQSEACVIDSVPTLRSLDTHAWEAKAREGTDRLHALEYFNDNELVRIAHWMTIAFNQKMRVTSKNITLRLLDPSDGRNNFRRGLRALARREPEALARLSKPRVICAA